MKRKRVVAGYQVPGGQQAWAHDRFGGIVVKVAPQLGTAAVDVQLA